MTATFKTGAKSPDAPQSVQEARFGGKSANCLGSQSRTTARIPSTIANPNCKRPKAQTVVVAGRLPLCNLIGEHSGTQIGTVWLSTRWGRTKGAVTIQVIAAGNAWLHNSSKIRHWYEVFEKTHYMECKASTYLCRTIQKHDVETIDLP